jgi:biopolymer transport protein TolQ
VPTDMSLLHLVTGASLIVQLVMLVLLLASIVSWAFIFQKSRMLTRAYRDSIAFEDRFWSGGNLRDLYNELQGHSRLAAMQRIFEAGFKEYMHSKVNPRPTGLSMPPTA